MLSIGRFSVWLARWGAIGSQIDVTKGAGINAFIMSWCGPKNNNLTSQVFNTLLDQANARGFQADVSLDIADPGYNSSVDEVIQSLQYAIGDRANQPAYLRYNGKPVIYVWNEGRYSVSDRQNILSRVRSAEYWDMLF
jgi:glycosyl hydrolase family 99